MPPAASPVRITSQRGWICRHIDVTINAVPLQVPTGQSGCPWRYVPSRLIKGPGAKALRALFNAVRLSKNVIPRRKATRPRAVSLVMRTIHLLGIRPKPPLCKGRWHGEAVTEGLSQRNMSISARFSANSYCSAHNPSVSLAADSSPYSGEP